MRSWCRNQILATRRVITLSSKFVNSVHTGLLAHVGTIEECLSMVEADLESWKRDTETYQQQLVERIVAAGIPKAIAESIVFTEPELED